MNRETDIMEGVFTYEMDEARKLCIVVAMGRITFESSIDSMNTVVNTPGFEKDFNVIVDLRLINYHPTYSEMLGLKSHMISLKGHFQNKIVLVTSGVLWIVAELMSKFLRGEGMNVFAFRDMDETMRWLSATE